VAELPVHAQGEGKTMSDQFPQNAPTWPGSEAGMPAPPGWPAPEPRSHSSKRRGIALVVAGVLAVSAALGLWAGTSLVSHPGSISASAPTTSASPNDGIVDISTFAHEIGQPTGNLVPLGAGTGMVLSSTGEVLTNNHVVQGASEIQAEVPGGDTYTATVVGVDPSHDVALLQLADASDLATIRPGDAATVGIGDAVAGIGNALGRGGEPAIATGSVTAVDRSITASDPNGSSEQLTGMIQTDADIQPGDSGGALVNADGQVVGMITAGNDRTTSTNGPTVGFAIPIDTALAVVDQIQSGNGTDAVLLGERGYLGVAVRPLDQTTAARLGVNAGALVVGFDTNSPAEGAGMTTPAVICAIDGQPVDSPETLGPLLHSHVPGDSVTVDWVDASGSHSASVALTTGPAV
jgi:S1-C subfamily serine protease